MEAQFRAGMRSLLVLLRALRLGAAYGIRIRMPHALVMNVLYGRDKSVRGIVQRVLGITWEHGRNLASFAVIYKAVLVALRTVYSLLGMVDASSPVGKPASPWHAAAAGALGAYLVWTPQSSVNLQILFYLVSRVLFALFRLLAQKGVQPFASLRFESVYPVLSVGVWSAVMWLYETHTDALHPSLASSMHDIYRDSNALPPILSAYAPSALTIALTAYAAFMGLPFLPRGPAAVKAALSAAQQGAHTAASSAGHAVTALRQQLLRTQFPALSLS
jgi:peroxisomal membrane protein 4